MNLCMFMGNMVSDPETPRTFDRDGKQNQVLPFTIAVNTRRGGQDYAVFPRIEAWGLDATLIATHFAKGDPIIVYTTLQTDKWTDKTTGENRYRDKYRLERFEFVPRRKPIDNGDATNGSAPNGETASHSPTSPQEAPGQEAPDAGERTKEAPDAGAKTPEAPEQAPRKAAGRQAAGKGRKPQPQSVPADEGDDEIPF